jgi:hypothetical protein
MKTTETQDGSLARARGQTCAMMTALIPPAAKVPALVLLPPLDFPEASQMVTVVLPCAGRRRHRSAMVVAVPMHHRSFHLSEEVARSRDRSSTEAAQQGRRNDRHHGEFRKEE